MTPQVKFMADSTNMELVTNLIFVEYSSPSAWMSAMVTLLVLAKSFPGSPQIWKESVYVEVALVLPDPSIEGECLVTLSIGVKPHRSVLVFLTGQVPSFSPMFPIMAHVWLLGIPRHCSTI